MFLLVLPGRATAIRPGAVGSVRSSTFSKIRRSIEGLLRGFFFYEFHLPCHEEVHEL